MNWEEKPEDWNIQQQRQNQEQNHHHRGRWNNCFGPDRTDWNEIETSNRSWMKGEFNNSNWKNENNSNKDKSNNSEHDGNDVH